MTGNDVRYFFVLSFTARDQAGLAIVIAVTEREAFEHLKAGGLYNGTPDDYVLVACKNVGKYEGRAYGLMLESFTNALVAFDALVDVSKSIVGPKGDRGEQGIQGEKGDIGPAVGINIGEVKELPIGGTPYVRATASPEGTSVTLDFGFPRYDIAPSTLSQLKSDLEDYVDECMGDVQASLDSWKSGVESSLNTWKGEVEAQLASMGGDIKSFSEDVESWVEEVERVAANALVRHEEQLNS